MLNSCVILDTETTGIEHGVDKLVEIAGVMFDSDLNYERLCNPGIPIPPQAMAIHHITEEMVKGQDEPGWAVHDMLKHLNSPVLAVAHNAKFDRPFINELAPEWQPTWVCTYKSAVMAWPDAPGHSNQVLRYWIGLSPVIPEGLAPHRALYDILVTKEIFRELLKAHPLGQLIEWSNNPLLLKIVSFGKHKGKLWSEVDFGYLNWCCKQDDMNEDVRYTAEYWLRNRPTREFRS